MKPILAIFLVCCGGVCAEAPVAAPAQLTELTAYLELSAAQAAELQRVYQTHTLAVQQQWAQINQKERALEDMLNSVKPDARVIGQLMIDIQEARREISDPSAHAATRRLLNESQRRKLMDLERALALRGALDQAIQTGMIEPAWQGVMMPPVRVSNPD